MTYPTSGDTPDPYQPQQPYGQPADPTAAYQPGPAPAYDPTNPYQPGPPPAYDPTTPYSQEPAPQPGPPGFDAAPAYGTPAYGPPGYPAQGGYGPPGYGTPGYGPPMYPYMVPTTNTLAILSLVFAFLFAPASIVLGHLAKKQIRQTGEQGEGLATAGLWLGYIFTGLGLLVCAGYFVAIAVAIGTSATTGSTHI